MCLDLNSNHPLLLATSMAVSFPPFGEMLPVHSAGSGPRGACRADVDESVALLR